MAAKVWEMVSKYLLIPLIKDLVLSLYRKWKAEEDEKRRAEEAARAAQAHRDAQTAEEAADTMEKLP